MVKVLQSRLQPAPRLPGIKRAVIRLHAQRLFRDVWAQRPLTRREWRTAEDDLRRRLESEAL